MLLNYQQVVFVGTKVPTKTTHHELRSFTVAALEFFAAAARARIVWLAVGDGLLQAVHLFIGQDMHDIRWGAVLL